MYKGLNQYTLRRDTLLTVDFFLSVPILVLLNQNSFFFTFDLSSVLTCVRSLISVTSSALLSAAQFALIYLASLHSLSHDFLLNSGNVPYIYHVSIYLYISPCVYDVSQKAELESLDLFSLGLLEQPHSCMPSVQLDFSIYLNS